MWCVLLERAASRPAPAMGEDISPRSTVERSVLIASEQEGSSTDLRILRHARGQRVKKHKTLKAILEYLQQSDPGNAPAGYDQPGYRKQPVPRKVPASRAEPSPRKQPRPRKATATQKRRTTDSNGKRGKQRKNPVLSDTLRCLAILPELRPPRRDLPEFSETSPPPEPFRHLMSANSN